MLPPAWDDQVGEVAGLGAAVQLLGQNAIPAGAAGAGGAGETEHHRGVG